jgi:7SK snRNA methylphosphate capping enzyme
MSSSGEFLVPSFMLVLIPPRRFSVTKWIHLNGLNAGLLTFFARAFSCLRPGGLLILEPQPFSTYNKAAKFSDELKANYNALRDGERVARGWRDEEGDFERVLLKEVGFERKESLGDTGIKGPSILPSSSLSY